MEELHRKIEKLTGSQAKSFLLNVAYRLKMIKESHSSQEEMLEELSFLYDEIIGESQLDKYPDRNYEVVHLVCGESAAGSLRYGSGPKTKVIGFPDLFAVGPIWNVNGNAGRERRYEWLKNHLNMEMDYYEDEYKQKMQQTLQEIREIPNNLPIVLWTAENADEQTGMRYILHLLKDKKNEMYLINTTLAYKEMFDTDEIQYFCLHTGEATPENLKMIDKKKRLKPLTKEERKQYEKEWAALTKTEEVLRIWEKGQIKSVNEDYFDPFIIETAQRLHSEQDKHDFILSARIIGDVLGHLDQVMGDSFLEYRVRTLIYNGAFEIKGIPKGMRYYSVKLK